MFLCCEEKGKRIPGPYQALDLFRLLCLYLPQGFVLPNYSLLFFPSLSSSYGIYPITSSVLTALFYVSSHFLIAFFLLEIRSLK